MVVLGVRPKLSISENGFVLYSVAAATARSQLEAEADDQLKPS
jgi:hypothetical protein